MTKPFQSVGKDGQSRTLEQTFWSAIDEAQDNWDKIAEVRRTPPDGMSGRGWDAYCSARLTGSLGTILTLAKLMRAQHEQVEECL